jgi:glutamate-1-semialdehyde 2,1-aminomutase
VPSFYLVGKDGHLLSGKAAKVARAYTGRSYIAVPRQQPFFSFDDWFIGSTMLTRGGPDQHAHTTLVFDYGDIASLQRLFDAHPGQIAGVMLDPATNNTQCAPG